MSFPFVHEFLNRGCLIGHDNQIGAFTTVGPGANLAGALTLGAGVYIGAHHWRDGYIYPRGSTYHRLERTIGTDAGLRVLFGGMTQRFRPDRTGGFTGEIAYELRTAAGQVKPFSGGGIYTGLVAARQASAAVLRAFENDDCTAAGLGPYERAWKRELTCGAPLCSQVQCQPTGSRSMLPTIGRGRTK